MKLLRFCSLVLWAALPAAADTKPAPAATATAAPAPAAAGMPKNPVAPPPATPPAATAPPAQPANSAAALETYLAALNDQLALSKDEQTDIKAYYQEDGPKLQAILNNPALPPMDQQRQIDDLRNARNAKIEALLKDVDRQAKFLELENSHRVDLVELAAAGGLTPKSAPPNVPQPTATPPSQADKTAPGV